MVFEDDSVLVVNKPPGWNTHAPAPYAGEGIYDWLRHREPRWASLAILHRLDKETSGLMVFGMTPGANRSLTAQFTDRAVGKQYEFITDRPVALEAFLVTTPIVRDGSRYAAVSGSPVGEPAETRFRVLRREGNRTWLEASPVTGRTHQIRVHAASRGLPILGDVLYGGTPSGRLHLHARRLAFEHPVSGTVIEFESVPEPAPTAGQLRGAFIDPLETDAFRLCQGAADGHPRVYADRLGGWLLLQAESEEAARHWLATQRDGGRAPGCIGTGDGGGAPTRGIYFKRLNRHVHSSTVAEACPIHLEGEIAPSVVPVRENGLRFELSFAEGYSVGLFLDQRDNRRRCLVNHVGAGFPLFPGGVAGRRLLNCFAYTCGFSVAAAAGGMQTTSLDLSRKYLDWGRRNFQANAVDPADHEFIFGDVFDWLRRLAKKGRLFDAVVLDPPTFSRSKEHGDFRAESDFGELATAALRVLAPGGVLLVSTNAARLEPERFLATVSEAVTGEHRRVLQRFYAPQSPDFPVHREEPAHLKTAWFRVE